MPTIAPLADGTWVAAQHVGQSLGSSDNHIEFLISRDEGATWDNRGSIHGGEGPDERYTYRAPKIVAIPDGRLLISADRYPKKTAALFNLESETLSRSEMLLIWSEDRGKTWSEPQVVLVDLLPERYSWNGTGANSTSSSSVTRISTPGGSSCAVSSALPSMARSSEERRWKGLTPGRCSR